MNEQNVIYMGTNNDNFFRKYLGRRTSFRSRTEKKNLCKIYVLKNIQS